MKRNQLEKATHCMISTLQHSQRGKTARGSKQTSGCQGVEKGGQSTENFQGSETILQGLQWWVHITYLSKSIE